MLPGQEPFAPVRAFLPLLENRGPTPVSTPVSRARRMRSTAGPARGEQSSAGALCGHASALRPALRVWGVAVWPETQGFDFRHQHVDGHVPPQAPRGSRSLILALPGCRPISPLLSSSRLKGPLFIDK